jgi:MtN3 and saliva related transmembrane protein
LEITQLIGFAAGVLTAVSLFPQVIKTIKEKKADHITPFIFIILIAGNGLWVYYGILKSDLPIVITNCFSLLMDITMLYLKFRYRKN